MIGKRNNGYCLVGSGLSLWLFFIFKQFYPNPNMVKDSYVYIRAAVLNFSVNSLPIGYSKFLQLFGFVSHSATTLVWLQYLLLETASMFFFLTILNAFKPSQWVAILLLVFLFCNPLFSYLSNFIMSDTLFTSLSIAWFALLIKIILAPRSYMILIQAALLVLLISVRYNAIYYPIVATIVLLCSRLTRRDKYIGIALQIVLIGWLISFTQNKMKEMTGVRQYSPFGGWQLANNALYMYRHDYRSWRDQVPNEFSILDSIVRLYFVQNEQSESLLDYDGEASGFYFTAGAKSPLIKYKNMVFGEDTVFQDPKRWGAVGPLYSNYGAYLIRYHPMDYFKYWIWPNSIRYFYPPIEIFGRYSSFGLRTDYLGKITIQLLNVETLLASWPMMRLRTSILSWYSLLFAVINAVFIFSYLIFFVGDGVGRVRRQQPRIILVSGVLWICNLGFSTAASCIVLRYQVFILVVSFTFSLLLLNIIFKRDS